MMGNPFAADIYPDGHAVDGGAHLLHANALDDLKRMVEEAGGRIQTHSGMDGGSPVVLLRAPRAGFGKSHLLARLEVELGDRAFVIGMTFDREREVQWSAVVWQVLETFHHGKFNDLTLLDLVTRRVFALVNQRMIVEKQVPCARPQEALAALEERFVDLFDFSNPAQPVAQWFAENFERLLPFAAHSMGQIAGLSNHAAAHWLQVLCSYAQGRTDGDTVRWEALRWSVMQPSAPSLTFGGVNVVSAGSTGESGARERVVEFCRLAASVRPLVLVFDDLDLFHHQEAQVQRIAGFISEMRRLLARSVQVLSVNQDLWAQTFLKALPSAIEDRLTGSQITLSGIGREEATQLIRTRLTGAGLSEVVAGAFLNRLNLSGYFSQEAGHLVSPRALLRYAARTWEEFERSVNAHAAVNGSAAPVPAMPAISVKVEDAPLYRLLPKEPEPGSVVPADPAFQHLRETLQKMLTPPRTSESASVAESLFTAGLQTPAGSGAILPHPVEVEKEPALPAPRRALAVTAPPPDAVLQQRFQQLRAHFLTAPWLAVDQDRLFHLLKIAGRRLAVVNWVDHPLPGAPGQTAGAWMGPDGEILFGGEPYEDRAYWSSLVDFTRERSGYGFGPAQGRKAASRLVVFSAIKAPVNLSAWMAQDEIIDARTHFLDVQSVDQSVLATLYAADEMMRDAERGSLGVNPAETFSALVPHLEFLWKQVTRKSNS